MDTVTRDNVLVGILTELEADARSRIPGVRTASVQCTVGRTLWLNGDQPTLAAPFPRWIVSAYIAPHGADVLVQGYGDTYEAALADAQAKATAASERCPTCGAAHPVNAGTEDDVEQARRHV